MLEKSTPKSYFTTTTELSWPNSLKAQDERLFVETTFPENDQDEFETLSPKLQKCIKEIWFQYKFYFNTLGISLGERPKIRIEPMSGQTIAYASKGVVYLQKVDVNQGADADLNFLDFCDFLRARDFAHETYHVIAPSVYHLQDEKFSRFGLKNIINKIIGMRKSFIIKHERGGLSYSSKKKRQAFKSGNSKDQSSALEEGRAMLMQEKMAFYVTKFFPEEEKIFRRIRNAIYTSDIWDLSEDDKLGINVSAIDLLRYKQNDTYIPESLTTTYKRSIQFEKFIAVSLRDAGYNYDKLIEYARLRHKTLPLARAIARVFGSGSYRMVMEATDGNCLEVMSQLKKLRKSV